MPEPKQARLRFVIALIYALAGLLLLLGLVLGKRDAQGVNRIPRPLRMLSSALVLLAALAQSRRGPSRLVAAGMGCGFAGDLVMAELIPLPEHVLFGMLSFGVGHGCYIRALRARGRQSGRAAPQASWLALAWLVALAGWLGLVRNPAVSAALNYGALAYALLLASMAGAAAALASADRRYTGAALGGGLFLLSDLILAARLFRQAHFAQIGDMVWLTYIAGQALIVDGLGRDAVFCCGQLWYYSARERQLGGHMLEYTTAIDDVRPGQLAGFFVGWPSPPTPATHLRILQGSAAIVLAREQPGGAVVGFITAISDGVSCAYIPHLEVLPAYRGQGVGSELVRRMLAQLSHLYMIDLICDADVQPFYERLGMRPYTGMILRNYDRQSGA